MKIVKRMKSHSSRAIVQNTAILYPHLHKCFKNEMGGNQREESAIYDLSELESVSFALIYQRRK